MSSVLPSFEYDIFISYRQKDNKGDGWVTEFVEALKTELEATFKEDISVYFDINPHDGLLETHDVAASLKEKLKALIFVPIVSRTYCDPNSYAWEHEFIAFIELASQDRFGLKVKLPGGNVASRILPIRIHDLEPEDIKLAESYLGFIRPVDFIYHSQGVNRPLRIRDDDLAKPGQQLVYRDQINKVANAVREIINGLKMGTVAPESEKEQPGKMLVSEQHMMSGEEKDERAAKKTSRVSKRKPLLWGLAISVPLIVAAILLYPRVVRQDTLENLRSSGKISIAVMPFQYLGHDSLDDYQAIIQETLINELLKSPDMLKAASREQISSVIQSKIQTENASITSRVAKKTSRTVGADVFVTGTIMQIGKNLTLTAKINDSKTFNVLQPFEIKRDIADIYSAIDSITLQIRDYLIITVLKKELPVEFRPLSSTISPKALRYFISGNDAFYKYQWQTAVEDYSNAIRQDSNFTIARIMWSFAYYWQSGGAWRLHEKEKEDCQKLYEKRDQLSPLDRAWTSWLHTRLFGETPNKQIEAIKAILKIDDQSPFLYYSLGSVYFDLKKYDQAIPEFEKAIDISKKWGSKTSVEFFNRLGDAYHSNRQYEKEKKLYKQALYDFPDHYRIIARQARLLVTEGDTVGGIKYMEEQYKSSLSDSLSEAEKFAHLENAFSYIVNLPEQAEKNIRQAIELEPNPYWIRVLAFHLWTVDKNLDEAEKYFRQAPDNRGYLAWFLIETGRNVAEGLKYVEEGLKLEPDDYNGIDTKGWGLYKLGKYDEAKKWLKKCVDIMPVNNPNADSIKQHLKVVEEAIKNEKKK